MQDGERQAKLDALLAEVLDIEPAAVTADLSAETCRAWDSAGHLRLVFAIEETFGIAFSLEQIEQATSRAALLHIVQGNRAGRLGQE